MRALLEYGSYLFVVHVAWVVFYACGTLLRIPRGGALPPGGADGRGGALVHIVVSTASGIAIIGLLTFLLGVAHLLYAATFAGVVIAIAAAWALAGDPPWRAAYWRTRAAVWRAAASPGAVCVYVAALAIGTVSVRPDIGSDALAYHVPYGIVWAHAHSLVVDLTLQNPFYANNWVLFDTWLDSFGLLRVTQTLTWFAGMLTLLGVYGYVRDAGERRAADPRLTEALALLSTVSVALSAIFLRWVNVAMIDVPIGLFFLASGLAFGDALRTRRPAAVAELIVCAGFFIGMKLSLILFFPLFACAVALAALACRLPLRYVAVAVVAVTACAAPWYAKNLIQTGDPIPPVFDVRWYGHDPKFDAHDVTVFFTGLGTGTHGGPVQRAALPLTLVTQPQDVAIREYGATLLVLFMWCPGALLAYALLRRRVPIDIETCGVAALAAFAVAYWTATTYAGRYTLTFTPLLAALAGAFAVYVATAVPALRRKPVAFAAALAIAGACAIPTGGSVALAQAYASAAQDALNNYTDRESWMRLREPAYVDVEYISDALHRAGRTDLSVYQYSIFETRQEFAERDITVVGDYYGPGRFDDFVAAAHGGTIAAFFARFHVGVLLLPAYALQFTAPDRQLLAQQLAALGFRRVVVDPKFEIFLSPAVR